MLNGQETIEGLKQLRDDRLMDYGQVADAAIALLEADAIPGGFERGEIVQTGDGQKWRVVSGDTPYVVIYAAGRCYEVRPPGALTRVPPLTAEDTRKAEIDRIAADGIKAIQDAVAAAVARLEATK